MLERKSREEKSYEFQTLKNWKELLSRIESYFQEKGFGVRKPMIITGAKSTLLMTSGIQQLEPYYFHYQGTYQIFPYLTFQPVIRTQYFSDVNISDGVFTIFVNGSIIGILRREHLSPVYESCLKFFEELFHAKKSELVINERSWRMIKGRMDERRIDFIDETEKFTSQGIEGIEVGDIVIKRIRNSPEDFIVFDCGFGIERLLLSLYGIGSFEDFEKKHPKISNALKSLMLLNASGVVPSNKDKGYRVRLFSKYLISELCRDSSFFQYFRIDQILDYYQQIFTIIDYPGDFSNRRILITELMRNLFFLILSELNFYQRKPDKIDFSNVNLDSFLQQFTRQEREKFLHLITEEPFASIYGQLSIN